MKLVKPKQMKQKKTKENFGDCYIEFGYHLLFYS